MKQKDYNIITYLVTHPAGALPQGGQYCPSEQAYVATRPLPRLFAAQSGRGVAWGLTPPSIATAGERVKRKINL